MARRGLVKKRRPGQPILAKEPIEDGADALALRGKQTMARQEIARVLIGDRQPATSLGHRRALFHVHHPIR